MQHRMIDLDPFERKILRELQRDASLTTAEIAERVGPVSYTHLTLPTICSV